MTEQIIVIALGSLVLANFAAALMLTLDRRALMVVERVAYVCICVMVAKGW